MSITIKMLGTGSAFAAKYLNNNALITCNGYNLLVDCGLTAPRALHQLQIPFDQIDGILITHLHGDHVGGLEEFAFQMLYIYKKLPVLWLPADLRTPLWENTLKGAMENKTDGFTSLTDYFEVRDLVPNHTYDIHPGFQLEILPVQHIPGKPSYGLYLNNSLYYSSDSTFDRERLITLLKEKGLKHVLHECQLMSPGRVHASLDELLTLPQELQAITLLMHYGDNMEAFRGKTGRMTFMEQHRDYVFDT
jgi:ribonuclease BN (tRNA processing enzyme)